MHHILETLPLEPCSEFSAWAEMPVSRGTHPRENHPSYTSHEEMSCSDRHSTDFMCMQLACHPYEDITYSEHVQGRATTVPSRAPGADTDRRGTEVPRRNMQLAADGVSAGVLASRETSEPQHLPPNHHRAPRSPIARQQTPDDLRPPPRSSGDIGRSDAPAGLVSPGAAP